MNTGPDDVDSVRAETCFHEAGHAVVSVARGIPIDYISLRPRHSDYAAHVVSSLCSHAMAFHRGDWESLGAIQSAGILAQWIHISNRAWPDDPGENTQRLLTRHCGRTDLKDLRQTCLRAWSMQRAYADSEDWSTTPIKADAMPVDLAVQAWRGAITTLAEYWDAVENLAEVLYDSPRKVTYRTVREIVEDCTPDHETVVELPDEFFHPWFLDHSRLKWEPPDRWRTEVERARESALADPNWRKR